MSGTGLFACQLAKNVFHAGKIITTVSTAKIPKLKELLGGNTVDQSEAFHFPPPTNSIINIHQVIDYTESDPTDVIDHGSVDFLFDTVGLAMQYLCLMRPGSSRIVSIATLPSGNQLQNSSLLDLPHHPIIPFPFRLGLNLLDQVRQLRARRYGVEYSYMILESSGKVLDELRQHVDEGRLVTVVSTIAEIGNIESVRNACEVVYSGKGGLGSG